MKANAKQIFLLCALACGCGKLRVERIHGGGGGNNQFSDGAQKEKSPVEEADSSGETGVSTVASDLEIAVEGPEKPVLLTEDLKAHAFIRKPIDILFAVDLTDSMLAGEVAYIETNLDALVKRLESDKIDWQLTVMAGNPFIMPAGVSATRLAKFNNFVGQDIMIDEINDFFANNRYVLPPRLNEHLEIVVVSDGNPDGAGFQASDFIPPAGRTIGVESLIGLAPGQNAVNAACNIENVGTQFRLLAEANKGAAFDICDKSWAKLYDRLLAGVTSFDRSPYQLAETPDVDMDIRVFVDGVELDRGKYLIDVQRKLLLIDQDIAPDSVIKVEYYKK